MQFAYNRVESLLAPFLVNVFPHATVKNNLPLLHHKKARAVVAEILNTSACESDHSLLAHLMKLNAARRPPIDTGWGVPPFLLNKSENGRDGSATRAEGNELNRIRWEANSPSDCLVPDAILEIGGYEPPRDVGAVVAPPIFSALPTHEVVHAAAVGSSSLPSVHSAYDLSWSCQRQKSEQSAVFIAKEKYSGVLGQCIAVALPTSDERDGQAVRAIFFVCCSSPSLSTAVLNTVSSDVARRGLRASFGFAPALLRWRLPPPLLVAAHRCHAIAASILAEESRPPFVMWLSSVTSLALTINIGEELNKIPGHEISSNAVNEALRALLKLTSDGQNLAATDVSEVGKLLGNATAALMMSSSSLRAKWVGRNAFLPPECFSGISEVASFCAALE